MLAKTITVLCNQLYSVWGKQKLLSESVQGPAHTEVEQDFLKFQGRGIFHIHTELCPK